MLGPSQWRDRRHGPPTPLEVRQRLRERLRHADHNAFLMEDTPGPDSPLQDKFEERLRSERATDALVYWPRGAKTVTLQQEFVILFGKQPKLRVWVLPEVGVLHFHQGYAIVDGEDRGRYSNDLLNAATILPWGTRDDLDQHVERLAAGLHALDE